MLVVVVLLIFVVVVLLIFVVVVVLLIVVILCPVENPVPRWVVQLDFQIQFACLRSPKSQKLEVIWISVTSN